MAKDHPPTTSPPVDPGPARGPAGFAVSMSRAHLHDIPGFPFPRGFGVRSMRPEDGAVWEEIERDAEPFFNLDPGLFAREFGGDAAEIAQRCYFITGERGEAVGTISAWHSRGGRGEAWGRIHWVAVRPAFQGKGLAKAGLSYALRRLAEWHGRAWLATQTARVGAIKLYLDFGFVPDVDTDGARQAWRELRGQIKHPAIDAMG